MKIKYINVEVLPTAYDKEVEIRVDVRTETDRYGFNERLPEDGFESLFERIMNRITYEIKEKTFDVSNINVKGLR